MAGLVKWDKSTKKIIQEMDQEWEEFVQENAFRDEDGYLVYSQRMSDLLGETALKGARYLARRGHWEAIKLLMEYMLRQPEQSFSVKISAKSAEETRAMIVAECVKMKLAPETAAAFAERARLAALEDGSL